MSTKLVAIQDVNFFLDKSGEVHRLINYENEASEDFRLAVETAVSDSLNITLGQQSVWLSNFIDHFDDYLISKYLINGSLDFDKYVQDVFLNKSVSYSSGTVPLLGNLYMPENREAVMEMLKSKLSDVDDSKCVSSAIWLAPEYQFWGRSSLLDEFYFNIQDSLPQLKKPRKAAQEHLYMFYPGTRDTKWVIERQLWSKRPKSVHFYSSDEMGGRVEVFFIPMRMACVLFHFKPQGNSSVLIPFGFMTSDPALIEKSRRLVGNILNYGKDYVGPAFDKPGEKIQISFAEQFGFLNYSGLQKESTQPIFGQVVDSDKHNTLKPISRNKGTMVDTAPRSMHMNNEIVAIDTDDSIIFKAGDSSNRTIRVSKNKQWRRVNPMPSINESAKHNLSLRTGVDLQRINRVTKSISRSIWNDWKTPEECAKKWAIDLGVSEAEIWRYFLDAVVIENK